MIGRIAVAASLAADAIAFYTLAEWLATPYEGAHPHAAPAWMFLLVALAAAVFPWLCTWYGLTSRQSLVATVPAALLGSYALVRIGVLGDWAVWDLTWLTDFLAGHGRGGSEAGRAVFAAVLLGATWLRVSYRLADEVEMETIPRSVGWGFIVVTGLVIVGAATDRSGEIARAGALFYALAILALASSQLALSGVTLGDRRAGGVVSLLLGGTLLATLAGLAIFGLLFGLLAPVLGPIIGATIEGVLTVLLTPIAWVLTRFFEWIFGGANPFPNLAETTRERAGEARDPNGQSRSLWEQWVGYALRAFVMLVITGMAILALAIFMRFRRRTAGKLEPDAAMSIAGSAGEDFRSWFRSLLPRRSPKRVPFASTETTRLYLEVLEQAERDGAQREVGETPAEFEPTLASRYERDVTAGITRAFEQARYAGREPDQRVIEELRRRWRTVR